MKCYKNTQFILIIEPTGTFFPLAHTSAHSQTHTREERILPDPRTPRSTARPFRGQIVRQNRDSKIFKGADFHANRNFLLVACVFFLHNNLQPPLCFTPVYCSLSCLPLYVDVRAVTHAMSDCGARCSPGAGSQLRKNASCHFCFAVVVIFFFTFTLKEEENILARNINVCCFWLISVCVSHSGWKSLHQY